MVNSNLAHEFELQLAESVNALIYAKHIVACECELRLFNAIKRDRARPRCIVIHMCAVLRVCACGAHAA